MMKPQLQAFADRIIENVFHQDPATWPLTELVYAAGLFAAAGLVFAFALHFAGLFIFFERRIAARMQARVGPNRVGPQGLLQFVVDGLKCLFKEDLVPAEADMPLFRMAPYFVVLGMVLAFAAMPFSSLLIASDINIGILFVLGVTSLVVIGVLMGGWGSNSKWALLGGMRAAAQVVSYEIPAALAVMTVILLAGSLSMQDLIKAQGEWPLGSLWFQPLGWAFFHSPFVMASFFIYFISALAEGNRTPFDLPEAESELVSGYNTEYAGMRFLMFFLGEFANVWLLCAIPVALYFGGWQIPWGTMADGVTPAAWLVSLTPHLFAVVIAGAAIPALFIAVQIWRYKNRAFVAIDKAEIPPGPEEGSLFTAPIRALLAPKNLRLLLKAGLLGLIFVHALGAVFLVSFALFQATLSPEQLGAFSAIRETMTINAIQLGIFVFKTCILVFIVIQLRWTLPRIRVDQMMTLCWKYLVPLSFVCVVGTLVWELILRVVPVLDIPMRLLMVAVSAYGVLWYLKRTIFNYKQEKPGFEGFRGTPMYYPPWRLP